MSGPQSADGDNNGSGDVQRGPGFLGNLRGTRFTTTLRQPPSLAAVLDKIVRNIPARGYFGDKRGIMSLAKAASSDYAERGPLDDLYRFLAEVGFIIRDSDMHTGWFVDEDQIMKILEACSKKRELPKLSPLQTRHRIIELMKKAKIPLPSNAAPPGTSAEKDEAEEEEDPLTKRLEIALYKDTAYLKALSDEEVAEEARQVAAHLDEVNAYNEKLKAEDAARRDKKLRLAKLQLEISALREKKTKNEQTVADKKKAAEEAKKVAEEAAETARNATKAADEAELDSFSTDDELKRLKRELDGMG